MTWLYEAASQYFTLKKQTGTPAATPAVDQSFLFTDETTLKLKLNSGTVISMSLDTHTHSEFLLIDSSANRCQGRLTLIAGTPIPTTDIDSPTVYWTPYLGNQIGLYTGSAWELLAFSEVSIKITDTQNGTTTSGNAIITGLTDTSQLIVGMAITGTGVGASSVIVSIDSATQVTGSVNSSASGTVAITFKVPLNLNLDIFAFNNAGSVKLEMVKWTSDTARATALALQDGIYVKTGALTRRYLGTVRTDIAGLISDTAETRFVFNYYNRVQRYLFYLLNFSHTYNVAIIRPWNNDVSTRLRILCGVPEISYFVTLQCRITHPGTASISFGIGVNSTTVYTVPASMNSAETVDLIVSHSAGAGLGYTALQALELGNATNIPTFVLIRFNGVITI